jgi:hypothetical protein
MYSTSRRPILTSQEERLQVQIRLPPGISLHELRMWAFNHHAIPSRPRKQESGAMFGALALGDPFRRHDENVSSSYVIEGVRLGIPFFLTWTPTPV